MNRILVGSFAVMLLASVVACSDDDNNNPDARRLVDARPAIDAAPGAPDAVPTTIDAAPGTPDSPLAIIDAAPPPVIDAAPPPVIDAPPNTPVVFLVSLTKDQEVPPCPNAGANARGSAMVIISADNSSVTVSGLEWTGLSDNPFMGHIHFGAAGVNGPIVLPLSNLSQQPVVQTFTEPDYQTGANRPATFADFIVQMKAGNSYLNLHTPMPQCQAGEIRGQIHQ